MLVPAASKAFARGRWPALVSLLAWRLPLALEGTALLALTRRAPVAPDSPT